MTAPRVEIRFSGNQSGFAHAFSQLHAALDHERLDSVTRYGVELVFEEIVSNVIKYGRVEGRELDISVAVEARTDEITLTFEDDGIPFDPIVHSAPPLAKSLGDEKVGGRGLTLVRSAANSMNYERTQKGRNLLTVMVRRLA